VFIVVCLFVYSVFICYTAVKKTEKKKKEKRIQVEDAVTTM